MNKKPLKPKNGLIIDENGNKRWYKDDQLHRTDGYAVELIDGTKEFWVNGCEYSYRQFLEYFTGNKLVCEEGVFYFDSGKLHREDGPAVELADGSKSWWVNGKPHREDGPAQEWADGTKYWCINGLLHRENGPAIERKASKDWGINGRHSSGVDGPATEHADFDKGWFINGVEVTEQIVMQPETITLKGIKKARNNEVRSIMIERYGWARYLADSKAKMIDKRDNAVENTKEALFVTRSFGNRLVVTCPTGRVFTLGVPNDTRTCEEAQQWLGNSTEEINVIGRT